MTMFSLAVKPPLASKESWNQEAKGLLVVGVTYSELLG